ncbi:hypothetical protein GEV33_004517 [Tenebrio molitor]|uniref:Reverse transcriptase domain-containing protein n=1 Tax=Tenebrio molitor TaxID=7067 RepID=A0A8J6LDC6_TENMO|nr:hypothetical protein GEV33_004517 [Tenebrio molitor]
MPARSSARGRKGEEPPEKASTSKMLSRETPSPSPAGAASTPSTRSMTLAKKNRNTLYNKTTLVITKAPLAPNFVKTPQVAANSPTITIAPINRKTPGPASAPQKNPFSVVVNSIPSKMFSRRIKFQFWPSRKLTRWIDSCRLLDYRNGKKFWTQFQTLTGQKTIPVHHLVRNNAIINTPLEKANCFAETLEQIHQKRQQLPSQGGLVGGNHPLRLLPEDDSLVVEVLPDEVELLKSRKATGPDELKAPIFKNLPRIVIVALTVIFNNCMRAHHFPLAWKHATTVMIPKPGKDPTNPLSCRPIILLNIAGKVFEKILSTRLKNFLEINNLLPPEQFGFRSERSTINPILEFYTDTTRHANLKEHTLAVFLDIERAFDSSSRDAPGRRPDSSPTTPPCEQARETP